MFNIEEIARKLLHIDFTDIQYTAPQRWRVGDNSSVIFASTHLDRSPRYPVFDAYTPYSYTLLTRNPSVAGICQSGMDIACC